MQKQRDRLWYDALRAYNGLDPSRYSQRRFAQINNAYTNLARQRGVPLSMTSRYMRTDMQSGRNKTVNRKVSGFNVAYKGGNGG